MKQPGVAAKVIEPGGSRSKRIYELYEASGIAEVDLDTAGRHNVILDDRKGFCIWSSRAVTSTKGGVSVGSTLFNKKNRLLQSSFFDCTYNRADYLFTTIFVV